METKKIGIPIKIVAFLFIVGGLLTLFPAIVGVMKLTNTIAIVTNVIVIILSVFQFIIGWFLIKAAKWAFICAIILNIIVFILYLLAALGTGFTAIAIYKLILWIVIFVLLMLGRNDFK